MDKVYVACLNEVVVVYLDNNNKHDFDVDIRHILDGFFDIFILTHPLEYILEVILGGQCIVHNIYMNKCVWSETCVHFSNDH